MESFRRTRVVLGFRRRMNPALIVRSQSVHDGIAAHPALFPSPSPAMPVFAQQIQELRVAQQAVTAGKGPVSVRDAKATIVISSLEALESYVQRLCDASPEQAAVIVEAATMQIARTSVHHKPELVAVNGPVSGSARLFVNRTLLTGSLDRATYINWQYSLDGTSWVTVPVTMLSQTEIHDLPRLTTVSFRASFTTSDEVVSPWTQAVTLLIV